MYESIRMTLLSVPGVAARKSRHTSDTLGSSGRHHCLRSGDGRVHASSGLGAAGQHVRRRSDRGNPVPRSTCTWRLVPPGLAPAGHTGGGTCARRGPDDSLYRFVERPAGIAGALLPETGPNPPHHESVAGSAGGGDAGGAVVVVGAAVGGGAGASDCSPGSAQRSASVPRVQASGYCLFRRRAAEQQGGVGGRNGYLCCARLENGARRASLSR